MFDVNRAQPYIVQIMDITTALQLNWSVHDRADMTGYRAIFRINDMFISANPYVPDSISGRFIQVVAP